MDKTITNERQSRIDAISKKLDKMYADGFSKTELKKYVSERKDSETKCIVRSLYTYINGIKKTPSPTEKTIEVLEWFKLHPTATLDECGRIFKMTRECVRQKLNRYGLHDLIDEHRKARKEETIKKQLEKATKEPVRTKRNDIEDALRKTRYSYTEIASIYRTRPQYVYKINKLSGIRKYAPGNSRHRLIYDLAE